MSIGSNIPYHSSLFEFKNLIGFSVTFKDGFYDDHVAEFLPNIPSFGRLWDMLIDNCPNLEELSITGLSPHPTDSQRLIQGRWPKLRKLSLGDAAFGDLQTDTADFFKAHRELQALHTSRHALSPTHLTSSLSIDHEPKSFALPHLTEFSGMLEQLQALTALGHSTLTTVGFDEPMPMHDDHISPLAVSVVLRGLPYLTTLSISFVLHSATFENGHLLKLLVSSCPRLVHLEFGCAEKPSFPIKSLSKAIQGLHKLRTLSIALVKLPTDESLHDSAVQLALVNPRLHYFTITFIPTHTSQVPIPQPLASHPSSYIESGTYTLTTDEHGLPVSLAAVERRAAMSWGISRFLWLHIWGGRNPAIIRRYQVNLRPRSSKSGLKGLGPLVMESSVAGEELRMLIGFVVLFCLAMWGFFVVGAEGTVR
jgi:hypothetical protein